MAPARRRSLSLVHTGLLIAVVLLPDFLGAVPVDQHKEEVSAVSSDAESGSQKLVRNRRNLAYLTLPQFQRIPDFWAWYKIFLKTQNQEGIEDLDRLYRIWLQNKHRSEEEPGFNHYLNHLGQIYKSCADSEDPECIAEATSKPTAGMVMPAPIKAAAMQMCNPFIDPYCLYPMLAPAVAPEPAPAKVPAPIFSPMLPLPFRSPTGFYYYAPVLEPFLSQEQKSELLRICQAEDVECLQYHLRAAYGYRPVPGPAPSYSALNCNPKDPYCKPVLVQKAPTGFYQMLYPNCDPALDPLCVSMAGPAPLSADKSPKEQQCNPLFDGGCNPLTATKLSGLTKPVLEYLQKDQPAAAPAAAAAASVPAPLTCDPRTNPFCILAAAHALRKPPPQLPQHQVRYRLGVPGKTRDGHDCYVHYDKDCFAVDDSAKAKASTRAAAKPYCHPFDPSCGKFSSPTGVAALSEAAGQGDIILPHPDCDPEIDYNCRLRRVKPASATADKPTAADEPPAAADQPAHNTRAHPARSFENFLSGYLSKYQQK